MPTPLVIPNAGLLKLRWSGETRAWLNVLGLIGFPTLPAFDQTLADTIHASLRGDPSFIILLGLLAPTVVFEGVAIRDISAANRAEFISAGVPASGSGTGDALPLSVAACVTIRTSLAGRSFRGRTYFSGFDEAQNDASGRQVAGVNTAIANVMGAIQGIVTGHTMRLAVLSRPQAARTIPARDLFFRPGSATAATAFVTRNAKWESQRRRTGRD